MKLLVTYLVIGVGSALGGGARYACGVLSLGLWGAAFPWGTIIINTVGSFIIGGFAALTGVDGRLMIGTLGRQFVMIGICGGYTTFSAFSLETFELLRGGRSLAAALNIALSLVLCFLGVWLGDAIARKVNE